MLLCFKIKEFNFFESTNNSFLNLFFFLKENGQSEGTQPGCASRRQNLSQSRLAELPPLDIRDKNGHKIMTKKNNLLIIRGNSP